MSLPDDDPVYTLKKVMEELEYTSMRWNYAGSEKYGCKRAYLARIDKSLEELNAGKTMSFSLEELTEMELENG